MKMYKIYNETRGYPYYREDYWPRSKEQAIRDAKIAHAESGDKYVVVEVIEKEIFTTE